MIDRHLEFRQILKFLELLELNNNREWFKENKGLYDEAHESVLLIVADLIKEIESFDVSISGHKPQDYLFRIYRDTRFSANKQPYKNHFGAFFCPGGRSSGMAGYYLHIERGKTMVAGGVYMPQASILKSIRTEVLYKFQDFNKIISDSTFLQYYSGLDDYKLSRVPKDFPADHPAIELVKYKSYICARYFSDNDVVEPEFLHHVSSSFRALKDFNLFLNNAIGLTHEG